METARRRRGGRGILVAVCVLATGGGSAIGWAATHQERPPTVPLSAPSAPVLETRAAPVAARVPANDERDTRARVRTSTAPAPRVLPPILPRSRPVSLTIPAIGVRSTLLHLGLRADGTLDVPRPGPDYDRAAWYTGSPTPGERGPAVIEGHVDSESKGPSVFYELGALERGDAVRVRRADGRVAVFTVQAVRRYDKDSFPTLLVYGNTDEAQLRLITCTGPFDETTATYRDNLVVFARLKATA